MTDDHMWPRSIWMCNNAQIKDLVGKVHNYYICHLVGLSLEMATNTKTSHGKKLFGNSFGDFFL